MRDFLTFHVLRITSEVDPSTNFDKDENTDLHGLRQIF